MATYKVVDAEQLDADLTTVADAIREKTGGTDLLSFPDGMTTAVDAVYEAGEKAVYDAFWDAYQDNGNRTSYANAFCSGWTDETFRPKYDIIPTGSCAQAFLRTDIKNLTACVENAGIIFDLSGTTSLVYLFNYAVYLEEVPNIDVTGASDISYLFNGCGSLRKVSLTFGGSAITGYTGVFTGCVSLEELTVSGTVDIPLTISSARKLNKVSIESVINALSDTTSGLTVTFSLTAVNNAFETSEGASEGAADGSTSEEWATLIATKSNWTISLV